jgi:hypothetical protein
VPWTRNAFRAEAWGLVGLFFSSRPIRSRTD